MPSNFYIADTHFGHDNIIRFDNRPFASTQEMEEVLVENWNKAVKRDDTVNILGDFCWLKEPEWIRILKILSGNKVLIRGNHDLKSVSPQLKKMFQDVKDYKEISDNGRKVIMCHYPILFYKSSYNPNVYMLCGHVHTTKENELLEKWRDEVRTARNGPADNLGQIYNVGCMMPYINYTPRTLDEILERFGK